MIMHLLQGWITVLPGALKTMASLGGTGVHVFIFCSGFGLYLSYLHKNTTYTQFIKTRFRKVYLPYIFIVCVSFFVPVCYSGEDRFMALLSHIFLFKMFIEKYEMSFGQQLWFISTIFQFYILFIPLCHIRERCKTTKIFAAAALTVSVVYWVFVLLIGKYELRIYNSFFLQYLWEFAFGMIVAEKLYSGSEIRISRFVLFAAIFAGLSIQAILALRGSALKMLNDIPALVGYGAAALLCYSFGCFNRFFQWLSGCSYELYLVHVLIFTVIFAVSAPQTLASQFMIGTVALAASALLAWCYNKSIVFVGRIRSV